MSPLLATSLIGGICIGCQWVAWRLRLPALVLLCAAGTVLGPLTGLLNPHMLFGENLRVLIAMAVAIILFDGGLGLRFKELKEMRRTVLQMVLIGAPLGWGMAACACHYIAQLSWPVSMVFGGILVVTGPTVILPLLRQTRLQPRAAAVLKWEGIVNDPLGALFAVIAFEYYTSAHLQHAPFLGLCFLVAKIVIIAAGSFWLGKCIEHIFNHGQIPEFLKQPLILVLVLVTYAAANIVQDEGGLVAVTILGITLANSDLPNLDEMRRFKEYLSLLLVSLVFILISATLKLSDLLSLNAHDLIFILVLLLIVRPLTVLISTVGAGMTKQELLFIGWIAPRGVVCAAVSGLFGPQLLDNGYADGGKLVPLAFGIVFVTVIGHGFTIKPWGRRLGLVHDQILGILLVGCNRFTIELSKLLQDLKVTTLIVDNNWYHLRLARDVAALSHYGEILSEDVQFKLDINRFGTLIAVTDNPSYNALVAKRFAYEFGHDNIYRLAVEAEPQNKDKASVATLQVPALFNGALLYEDVIEKLSQNWKLKAVRMTEEHTFSEFKTRYGTDDMFPLLSLTQTKLNILAGVSSQLPESGYTLIALTKEQSST